MRAQGDSGIEGTVGRAAAPIQVLVIDDDPEFLAYAQRMLDGEVTVVTTVLDALWALEQDCFDVVVCDLVFRDVDGRELLDLIHERWPQTSCVLVTGFAGRLTEDARSSTPVILKPCDFDELNQVIAAAIRRTGDG